MKLLSVTKVIISIRRLLAVTPDRLAFAAERGSAVHGSCAAYARRLPIILPDNAVPYFESFRGWFDSYVRRAIFVEDEFIDPGSTISSDILI